MNIPTDGYIMQAIEKGNGPEVIVCVHGFISSSRWWKPFTELLSPSEYHTYAINLHGATGDDAAPDAFTFARYAEDLNTFIEQHQLSNFTLVGHSIGSAVATLHALSRSESVKALVLISPL